MTMTENPARRFLCGLLFIFALAGLSGCTVNPATGKQSFTGFMSPEREKEAGAEEHPKILQQFGGVYDDPGVSGYVAEIGFKLARVSEMPDLAFRFTVLNDDQINAFALPGGYVYVTRGLIALAETEAELAGVIGHEIGHVTARHTAERYSKTIAANVGLQILGVLGSVYGVPQEAGGLLSSGATAILQGYSREQELEADMLGVRYLTRVGYNPDGMTSFFRKLKAHDQLKARMENRATNEENYNFASSHPRTTDRIKQAIRLARTATVANPVNNRDRMLNALNGILFGGDPAQGIIRGREFIHPDLRFLFTVPEGFTLVNTPDRVLARHENGASMIFDMAPAKQANKVTRLDHYLTDEWGGQLGLKDVEQLTVNGMEAWTGAATQNTDQGRRSVRLVVIRDAGNEIFRFAFLTPVNELNAMEEDLRRTTHSLKRLSEAEAAEVKPLRIRVVRTGSGMTAQDLANAMAVEPEYAMDWLELLNSDLDVHNLPAGTPVKIVQH